LTVAISPRPIGGEPVFPPFTIVFTSPSGSIGAAMEDMNNRVDDDDDDDDDDIALLLFTLFDVLVVIPTGEKAEV